MKIKESRNKNLTDVNRKSLVQETSPLNYQVKEKGLKYEIDMKERTFKFAIDIILLLRLIPYNKENDVVRYQLAKSGTSVGANYEESQATNSRAEFRHRIGIALREARESNYWLRIMERTGIGNQEKVKYLIQESAEIKSILGAIYTKVSK